MSPAEQPMPCSEYVRTVDRSRYLRATDAQSEGVGQKRLQLMTRKSTSLGLRPVVAMSSSMLRVCGGGEGGGGDVLPPPYPSPTILAQSPPPIALTMKT